jgi:hypothetical protein
MRAAVGKMYALTDESRINKYVILPAVWRERR